MRTISGSAGGVDHWREMRPTERRQVDPGHPHLRRHAHCPVTGFFDIFITDIWLPGVCIRGGVWLMAGITGGCAILAALRSPLSAFSVCGPAKPARLLLQPFQRSWRIAPRYERAACGDSAGKRPCTAMPDRRDTYRPGSLQQCPCQRITRRALISGSGHGQTKTSIRSWAGHPQIADLGRHRRLGWAVPIAAVAASTSTMALCREECLPFRNLR